MNFLKLLHRLVLRHIREDRFMTALSVLGVALGIGLFTGVQAASDRALNAFAANVQGVNPRANYEIVDTAGVDFPETVYPRVRSLEPDSLPLLQVNAFVPAFDRALDIVGLYTVRAGAFLGFAGKQRPDVNAFLTKRNGIFVTRKFAERHGVKPGDVIAADVYNNRYPLAVVDVLEEPSLPADAVFMDLGNFQEYFGKAGSLTKIDLITDDGTAAALRQALPGGLAVDRKEEVVRRQQSLIASFRYNLQFVTFLAVLVGVFLLYNTIFISVVKRRSEIGALRGLGMGRGTAVLLFIAQGLILGGIGSVLGLLLGQVFAYFSIAAVERTVSTMVRSIAITDRLISGKDALLSLGLGLLASCAASAIPAFETARVRPNESAREGSFERRYRRYQRAFTGSGAACILGSAALVVIEYRFTPLSFPFLAYGGILLFILGCTFVSPAFLSLLLRVVKGPATRLFGAPGAIAVSDIDGSRYRFSVALMSVAVSAALIVAMLSSIYSLKRSLLDWVEGAIVADVYVKPASCTSNYCFQPVAGDVVRMIRSAPETADVERFRALRVSLSGADVLAGFGDTAVRRKYVRDRHDERRGVGPDRKTVFISDYLAVQHGLKTGDRVELGTPRGRETFTITDRGISYSTTSGFLYFDRKWLKELWGLDDATQLAVYLKKGADPERFIERLRTRTRDKYSLVVLNNRELKDTIMTIFNRSFTLTYAIEVIAIAISLIGVVNTLLILVLEKKREISIVRYLGADWGHIRSVMVVSAGIVGVAGVLLGSLMGPVIGAVVVHVINKISFGWEVALRIPHLSIALLMLVLFAAVMTAAVIPSLTARKIDPKAFISFE